MQEMKKAKHFTQISELFYKRNFGTASKAEIELLMFHFYMEELLENNKNEDGTIDYNQCSDYRIAKELGITPQRVRNLKVKKQLVYPVEFDWKIAFAKLIKNARWDQKNHMVILNISDPNLFLEIQNYIEEQGAYIDLQLNKNLLKLRAEYFIELAVLAETQENRKKIVKQLKRAFRDSNKNENKFDEKKIGRSLIEGFLNLPGIIEIISELFQTPIGKEISTFLLKNLA